MSKKVTFATLSANFDKLCDEVVKHRKPIIIENPSLLTAEINRASF